MTHALSKRTRDLDNTAPETGTGLTIHGQCNHNVISFGILPPNKNFLKYDVGH
jgi:hypothetical protein